MCCETSRVGALPDAERAQDRAQHRQLDPTPASAREAREFVASVLTDLDDETLSSVQLAVSELVTNAVLHARTPLTLGVGTDSDVVLVAVGDRAGATPTAQPRSMDGTSGRGLAIVAEIAISWGAKPHPSGKTVWCTIRRATPTRTTLWTGAASA